LPWQALTGTQKDIALQNSKAVGWEFWQLRSMVAGQRWRHRTSDSKQIRVYEFTAALTEIYGHYLFSRETQETVMKLGCTVRSFVCIAFSRN